MIISAYHISTLFEAVLMTSSVGGTPYISLCQAVMALKSNEFPNLNLFQSVDHNAHEGRVFFVYHSQLESEAQAVVPILALIMETKFGPIVWWCFFSFGKGRHSGLCVDRGKRDY